MIGLRDRWMELVAETVRLTTEVSICALAFAFASASTLPISSLPPLPPHSPLHLVSNLTTHFNLQTFLLNFWLLQLLFTNLDPALARRHHLPPNLYPRHLTRFLHHHPPLFDRSLLLELPVAVAHHPSISFKCVKAISGVSCPLPAPFVPPA